MNDFKPHDAPRIKPGFSTPEGYFESFPERIMQQLPGQTPKVMSLWGKNKRWIYATAAIMALSLSIPLADYFRSAPQGSPTTEMENYLSYQSTLTEDDLIELLSQEENEESDATNRDAEAAAIEEILSDNAHLEEYIIN